jgi:1,6-anhydro-N-acetylmuramate kinase
MGAPLSGFFEAALLRHTSKLRVSQNLGGIGNVTVVPPASTSDTDYIAFDTGPGNVLIDAAVREITNGLQHYDRDGLLGAAGESEIDETFIQDFIDRVGFFAQPPPKTTGRELFSDDVARRMVRELRVKGVSDEGIIANITHLTGETVAQAYERHVIPKYGNIDEIYVCGGGARNPNLMKFLQARFPLSRVDNLERAPLNPAPKRSDSQGHIHDGLKNDASAKAPAGYDAGLGIPADAKEALLFAVLGFLCICGRSITVAGNENSTEEAILGKITPGCNYIPVTRISTRDFAPTGQLRRLYFG